jgi:hypothetical protein
MDTKEVQNKLQKAYESMLEHVEELVEKDKKPIKEAFQEAEEKLSEWRELSREEVEHISDELRSNLSDLGETTYRVNQSLKQTLSFDASYLASSIWNSLSKIADKTVVELSELDETLQRNMATDAANYSEQQEIWLNDAMQWQSDYEAAIKRLDELKAGVRKQIRKINKYSKAISKIEASEENQENHDLLAQINQEITSSIDELYQKLMGDDHDK